MFNCESCGWYSGKICFYADKLTTPSSSCEAWKEQETPSETRWIPVSERLPETKEVDCLVTVLYSYGDEEQTWEEVGIDMAYFYHGRFQLSGCDGKVLAWMPLPEPYNP